MQVFFQSISNVEIIKAKEDPTPYVKYDKMKLLDSVETLVDTHAASVFGAS